MTPSDIAENVYKSFCPWNFATDKLSSWEELIANMGGSVVKLPDVHQDFVLKNPTLPRPCFTIVTNTKDAYSSVPKLVGHTLLHMGYLVDKDKWEAAGIFRACSENRPNYEAEVKEVNEFLTRLLNLSIPF